jgi:hypothetical protein
MEEGLLSKLASRPLHENLAVINTGQIRLKNGRLSNYLIRKSYIVTNHEF